MKNYTSKTRCEEVEKWLKNGEEIKVSRIDYAILREIVDSFVKEEIKMNFKIIIDYARPQK